MRLRLLSYLLLLCYSSAIQALTLPNKHHDYTPLRRTVYQFPTQTWIESIAVRSNGDLLITLVDRPEVYLVSPTGSYEPILLHRFTGVTALLGITEVAHDEFAIVAGNWSIPTFSSTPGTYSIWTATFPSVKSRTPVLRHVVHIAPANFLNGVATLDAERGVVLVGDAGAGEVYRVDIRSGAFKVVLGDDATMGTYPVGSTHSGINGLKVLGEYVYYTNTARGLFARVKINVHTGTAVGPYETLATPGGMDDFAFAPSSLIPKSHNGGENGKEGWIAYATGHASNILIKITPDGEWESVFGGVNSTILEGDTDCAFGRGKGDEGILYVVTDGGIAHPLPGGFVQGGEVIALDVARL
ncbi:hypothetical protein TWF694_005571 [Orbilia ellipsospora]|uniref:Uncharacterized protein n=1 Tax=Orbilia ellipsospora TaxID=2528407 RepID=A0AAV9WTI5_9PEZI